jgi:3-oxoadipate enol-lactonase
MPPLRLHTPQRLKVFEATSECEHVIIYVVGYEGQDKAGNRMGSEAHVPHGGPHPLGRSARSAGKGLAAANGTQLFFESAGTGPPLVLIPETGTDRRIWHDQVAAFAERYRVVRYDLRGWGRSPRHKGVYRYAEDLAALLDCLGIERAALVGLYSGADVALDLALERPERVAALVLVEPFLSDWILTRERPPAFDAQIERLMAAAGEPNPATRVVRMVGVGRAIDRQAYAPDAQPQWTWRRRWANVRLWAILLENLPRTLAMDYGGPYTDWRHLRAVDPQDLDPEAPSYNPRKRTPPLSACLEQVVAPTLIARGAPTPSLALEHDEELLGRIAGAEVAVVADATRLPHMIQPNAFNGVVLDFLRRVYPPR